jgi:hypothetical protein
MRPHNRYRKFRSFRVGDKTLEYRQLLLAWTITLEATLVWTFLPYVACSERGIGLKARLRTSPYSLLAMPRLFHKSYISKIMRQEIDAMATSLRVFTAIVEPQEPEPADVDELRRFAPLSDGAEPDELACAMILKALKRRAELRKAVAHLGSRKWRIKDNPG